MGCLSFLVQSGTDYIIVWHDNFVFLEQYILQYDYRTILSPSIHDAEKRLAHKAALKDKNLTQLDV